MTPMVYISKRGGRTKDTIHVAHPWEECNTDNDKGGELVPKKLARQRLTNGKARICKHCAPLADG